MKTLLLLFTVFLFSTCNSEEKKEVKTKKPNLGEESDSELEPETTNYENELDEELSEVDSLPQNLSCSEEEGPIRKLYQLYSREAKKIEFFDSQSLMQTDLAQCVKASLQMPINAPNGYYMCPNSRTMLSDVSLNFNDRPCVDDSIVVAISSELKKATSCLGLNLKFVYSIFHTESRFQPLITSYTYAAGVGQLTKWPVREVNNNWEQLIEDKAYGDCSYLNDEKIKISPEEDTYSCSRIALKSGLRKNIVYSTAYILRLYRMIKPKVETWISSDSNLYSQKNLVLRYLIRASYNGGPTMVLNYFNQFVTDFRSDNIIDYDDFTDRFTDYLRSDSNREAYRYNDKIQNDISVLNHQTQIQCGV